MIAKVYVKQLITDSRINSRVGNSLVKFLSLYVSPREATDISHVTRAWLPMLLLVGSNDTDRRRQRAKARGVGSQTAALVSQTRSRHLCI
jgi:hypothetical protein